MSEPAAAPAPSRGAAPPSDRPRLLAVDATRGLALMLMLVDHAGFFAHVNVAAETYAGRVLRIAGPGWFATGLLTNVSAPTFWFLGGISVALMSWRERMRGSTDDFLLIRAGLLILIDLLLVSWEWDPLKPPHATAAFELLTCLAGAMLLMIPVRRLPDRALLAVTAGLLAGYAALVRAVPQEVFERLHFPGRWLVTFDVNHPPVVTFPIFGWFGLMVFGLWCGRRLADGRWRDGRPFVVAALVAFATWAVARVTGFGSADSWRPGDGLQALLLMRKGPPYLDYLAFNLGFGFLALAGFLGAGDALRRSAPGRWCVAWGQAPLFLFVVHLLVAFACARLALHVFGHREVPRYVMTVMLAALALLPMAVWYRRLKERHPATLLRFL
jgi:uncharacterized membrane protein